MDRLKAIDLIVEEHKRVNILKKPLSNFPNGYAIILKELDGLWDEIKKKSSLRDDKKILNKAKQVGVMALRFLVDLCYDIDI